MIKVERSRIALLTGGAAFAVLRTARIAAGAGPGALPEVTVYKSPICGCCTEWVAHLRRHGFPVKAEDVTSLQPVEPRHGVPAELQSGHTALVGGDVVEGHVPADPAEPLLRERPKAGIAVPGTLVGSPGMEVPDSPAEPYRVLTFDRSGTFDRTGKTGVFAKR